MAEPSNSPPPTIGRDDILAWLKQLSTAPYESRLRDGLTCAVTLLLHDMIAGRTGTEVFPHVRARTAKALAESMMYVDLTKVNLSSLETIARWLKLMGTSAKGSLKTRARQRSLGEYLGGIVHTQMQLRSADQNHYHDRDAKEAFFRATEFDETYKEMMTHLKLLASNSILARNIQAALQARETGTPGW